MGAQWDRELRLETIGRYGGRCVCCGESRLAFLVIDHEDGGGNEHRRALPHSGHAIYRWLRQHNWPDGFRVLCCNCNAAMTQQGNCWHLLDYIESIK